MSEVDKRMFQLKGIPLFSIIEPRHEKNCFQGFMTRYNGQRACSAIEASQTVGILDTECVGIILSKQ